MLLHKIFWIIAFFFVTYVSCENEDAKFEYHVASKCLEINLPYYKVSHSHYCCGCAAGKYIFGDCRIYLPYSTNCKECPLDALNRTFTSEANTQRYCNIAKTPRHCLDFMHTNFVEGSNNKDARCECINGTFALDPEKNGCALHRTCPPMFFKSKGGNNTHDTQCRRCPKGMCTYEYSNTKVCRPCSTAVATFGWLAAIDVLTIRTVAEVLLFGTMMLGMLSLKKQWSYYKVTFRLNEKEIRSGVAIEASNVRKKFVDYFNGPGANRAVQRQTRKPITGLCVAHPNEYIPEGYVPIYEKHGAEIAVFSMASFESRKCICYTRENTAQSHHVVTDIKIIKPGMNVPEGYLLLHAEQSCIVCYKLLPRTATLNAIVDISLIAAKPFKEESGAPKGYVNAGGIGNFNLIYVSDDVGFDETYFKVIAECGANVLIGGCSILFPPGCFLKPQEVTARAYIGPINLPHGRVAITAGLDVHAQNMMKEATVNLETWCVSEGENRSIEIWQYTKKDDKWNIIKTCTLGHSKLIEFKVPHFCLLVAAIHRLFGVKCIARPLVYHSSKDFIVALVQDTELAVKKLSKEMEITVGGGMRQKILAPVECDVNDYIKTVISCVPEEGFQFHTSNNHTHSIKSLAWNNRASYRLHTLKSHLPSQSIIINVDIIKGETSLRKDAFSHTWIYENITEKNPATKLDIQNPSCQTDSSLSLPAPVFIITSLSVDSSKHHHVDSSTSKSVGTENNGGTVKHKSYDSPTLVSSVDPPGCTSRNNSS